MDNNKNKFRPIEPKQKKFNVTQTVTRFPNRAMVTLSEVKEGTSKMITLSPKAIEAIGLTAENNRFAISRGYTDSTKTQEAIFSYSISEEGYTFTSPKGNGIKMDSAKLKWTTRRAMSAKFHSVISGYHSTPTNNNEKYFALGARYDENYWRLEEWQPTEDDQIVTPREDEHANASHNDNSNDNPNDNPNDNFNSNEPTNIGETVDVSID